MPTQNQKDQYRLSYFLNDKRITDLKPYLNILRSFPNLRYLSLKNNKIQDMPSELKALQSLQQLDISGNNLNNVISTLQKLKVLKKLKSLHIDISRSLIDKVKSILPQVQYLNAKQLYSFNQKFNYLNWEPIQPSVETAHLSQIAHIYELINNLLLKNHSEDSNKQFLDLIHEAFSNLHRNLNPNMEKGVQAMLVTRTRVQIEQYCLELILKYLSENNIDLKILLEGLLRMHWRQYSQIQKIVLYQSKIRINQQQLLNTREMTEMRQRIAELKEEVNYLSSQVNQLSKDNSLYLQKLISYSKGNVQSLSNLNFDTKYKDVKLLSYSTPIETSVQKRFPTIIQMQETIYDIYDKKAKHQSASKKRITMSKFIETYFDMSFGKDLSKQNLNLFKQNLSILTETENNNIVLFSKILNNQCEEQYISQLNTIEDNLIKKLKMYVRDNQKKISQINSKKINFEEVQRILESRGRGDLNIDISGLRILFRQVMMSQQQIGYILDKLSIEQKYFDKLVNQSVITYNKSMSPNKSIISRTNSLRQGVQLVSFRQVIKTILNMKLQQHIYKIQEIIYSFKERDLDNDGIISANDFMQLATEFKKQYLLQTQTVTFSEVIVEFTRKKKINKKQSRRLNDKILIDH